MTWRRRRNLDLGRVRGTATTAAPVRGPSGVVGGGKDAHALGRRGDARTCSTAFTLTELLIVIGIAVLFIAIAVPAFNLISGERSIAGAQNVLAAELANARIRAISQQKSVGVLFYLDPANERVSIRRIQVVAERPWIDDSPPPPPKGKSIALVDLVAEAEPVFLPAGVSMQFLRGTDGGVGRYGGFQARGAQAGRVVMFDGGGRISVRDFWFQINPAAGRRSAVADLLGLPDDPYSAGWKPPARLWGEVGFVLFDRGNFSGSFAMTDGGDESAEEDWLDRNGTLLVLSRYNGTFVQEGR